MRGRKFLMASQNEGRYETNVRNLFDLSSSPFRLLKLGFARTSQNMTFGLGRSRLGGKL